MLGWIGRWAQSKGMKLLPSWLGVDKTTAQSQIVTEGFVVGTVTESASADSAELANHNKVISQTPTSATEQDYETPVNITWRNFAFTPFAVFGFSPTPPFGVFGFSPFAVFGFSPFTVFGFSPFNVFGFSPFNVFGFSPTPPAAGGDYTRCTSADVAAYPSFCNFSNCCGAGSGAACATCSCRAC
jgi:hypothetical protein